MSADPNLNKATFSVFNKGNQPIEMYVYKPSGTLVTVITAGTWSADMSKLTWDGKTNSGTQLEGGVYVWQIKVGGAVAGKGTVILAK